MTDPAPFARGQAIGRIALASAMLVAPSPLTRVWIGWTARAPGARVLTRGQAARELAIGMGTLNALSAGSGVTPWLRAGVAGDVADLFATLVAWRSLPQPSASVVAVLAGGSAVLGLWLQAVAERPQPGGP